MSLAQKRYLHSNALPLGGFESMQPYLHGTTSSSLKEVRLGKECFGGETHAYSVAYADHEIKEVLGYCDKIIFNSINQLKDLGNWLMIKIFPLGFA